MNGSSLRRITYVVNVFPKFSETFIANEIAELRRRGVEVQILSRRRPAETLRHAVVIENGLENIACYDPAEFEAALRRFRPQLIHAHFATRATETARTLAAATGLPYTFTAHRYDIYDRPPADFATRCRAAAAVITVAEANARYMTSSLGAPRAKLHVIPCGIDTRQFAPGPRTTETPPWIVCVARLHPVKNLPMLLQACALLRNSGLPYRCAVIGEGDARPLIEAERRRLGLDESVFLAGAADQSQVCEWWQRAAVGVLTSRSEGMPVSLMEAMACGVPVVGTAVGGIPEMINDGHDGYVVPADAPARVAEVLARLLADPERARQMGTAARMTALRRFSVQAQVDALLAVWQEVVRQCQPA